MGYQDEDDLRRKTSSCSCNGGGTSGYYPPDERYQISGTDSPVTREGTPGFQNYDVPRNLGIQVKIYFSRNIL